MPHQTTSKISSVLDTDGQNSFGCGGNGLTADMNTPKHNIPCHLVTICGGNRDHTKPPVGSEPLLHSPQGLLTNSEEPGYQRR